MPWSMKKRRPIVAPGVNFDAGEKTGKMRDETRQPAQAMPPQPVREAVHDQRVNARIAGQHLPERTRRRIAVENRTNILTQMPEHESRFPCR